MGYPEPNSVILHLDPVARILYVNAEARLIPKTAVKCRALFDSAADLGDFIKALERHYTLYMSDDNALAADIGVTTFTRHPRARRPDSPNPAS